MKEFILDYWAQICAAVTAIAGFIKFTKSRAKKQNEWRETITASILAILHDRLLFMCLHYLEVRKITADEMDNLTLLFDQYTKLGGNGTIKKLMDRVMKYVKIIDTENERGNPNENHSRNYCKNDCACTCTHQSDFECQRTCSAPH